jgi:H+-transporting ATPase
MNYPNFFENRTVPLAGTESVFIASVIGCTYWVVVAWIW